MITDEWRVSLSNINEEIEKINSNINNYGREILNATRDSYVDIYILECVLNVLKDDRECIIGELRKNN
jgi:hypothetical protein